MIHYQRRNRTTTVMTNDFERPLFAVSMMRRIHNEYGCHQKRYFWQKTQPRKVADAIDYWKGVCDLDEHKHRFWLITVEVFKDRLQGKISNTMKVALGIGER